MGNPRNKSAVTKLTCFLGLLITRQRKLRTCVYFRNDSSDTKDQECWKPFITKKAKESSLTPRIKKNTKKKKCSPHTTKIIERSAVLRIVLRRFFLPATVCLIIYFHFGLCLPVEARKVCRSTQSSNPQSPNSQASLPFKLYPQAHFPSFYHFLPSTKQAPLPSLKFKNTRLKPSSP